MFNADRWSGAARRIRHHCQLGAFGLAILSACAVTATSTAVGDLDELDDEQAALRAIKIANASLDAAARRELPSPGAAGIGDPLFPTLGNGGYEVEHYDLRLRYETADPLQPIDGTALIIARATQALSRLNLDFAGDAVNAVRINGLPATFLRDGEDLVIKPILPLLRGQLFLITVSHFASSPKPIDPTTFVTPFFVTPSGSAWALQPSNAHLVFPSNDHPSDMASFTFKLDVPEGTTAVASGVEIARHTIGGRTISVFEQSQPMATELAQVVVGAFTVVSRGEHAGVTVRDVLPTSIVAGLGPKLAVETAHLDFMRGLVGDYPFSTYGSLVGDASFGFALETQTLSLFSAPSFNRPESSYGPIMVHELAHQWFGDSVAPKRWSDLWANEGHATWYEMSFRLGLDSPAFTNRMRQLYSSGDRLRGFFGPVANPPSGDIPSLFNSNVYNGGALALYALRQQVGDTTFQEIERAWVTTFRGKSASTADFIALSSQVSGQDLDAFLTDWFYGTLTPPMPGHPDWTVIPFLAGPESFTATMQSLSFPDDDLGLIRR
jgi:aminopeptidase N